MRLYFENSSEKVTEQSKRCKGNSLLCFPDNYVLCDIETTGLNSNYDEIIEVAAIKVVNNEIIDTFSTLVKPLNEIEDFITELTGITNEMVGNAPTIEDVILEFMDFVGENIIIGHNVNFDINFLYDKYLRCHNKFFANDFVDTLRISRKLFPDLENHKLCTLVRYFNIDDNTEHRALSDCYDTYHVYLKLKDYAEINNFNFSKPKKITIQPNQELKFKIDVADKAICLTGDFRCGNKELLIDAFEKNGAIYKKDVSKKVEYLIIGEFGSPQWKFGSFGTKFEEAKELQEKGCNITILNERDFIEVIDNVNN